MSDSNSVIVAKLLYNCEACFLEIPDFEVKRGDLVVLETDNGPEIAAISGISSFKPENASIKKIIRKRAEIKIILKYNKILNIH